MNRRALLGLAVGLTGALALGLNASAKRGPLKIGEVVKAPVLRNIVTNKPLDLASFKGKKVVVGIFMQKNCGTTWKYYGKMGEIIKNYQKVVVFGPTNAKSELTNLLKEDHHFDEIEIEVKSADKMTEHQMHAFVKDGEEQGLVLLSSKAGLVRP